MVSSLVTIASVVPAPWRLPALIAVICTISILLVRWLRNPYLANLPGPAGVKYTNFWRFKTGALGNSHRDYQNIHKRYGPVVRIGPNHVSLSDPAVIPEIYGISSKYIKSGSYTALTPLHEGHHFFSVFSTQSPAEHKRLKSGVAAKYSLSSLLKLEPLVDAVTDTFLRRVREISRPSPGQEPPVLDLGVWLQFYAFDVIGAITFSQPFGFLETGTDHNGVIAGIEAGVLYGSSIGQLPFLHPYLFGSELVNRIMAAIPPLAKGNPVPVVAEMMRAAIASVDSTPKSDSHEDFVTFLKAQNKKSPEKMTEYDMKNHMFVNLMAGSDTTAIALRSIFYYALKQPHIYARLQAEIDAAESAGLLSTSITFAESQTHLPYLALVIKEALRLHPPFGLPLERVVPAAGLHLDNGIYLPPGTVVGVNTWVIHYNAEAFGKDVEEFKPERWESRVSEDSGEEAEKEAARLRAMNNSYLPFGHGARTCIGKNISLMELAKFVPAVLREFEVEWAGGDEWDLSGGWFVKQTGVLVRLRARK